MSTLAARRWRNLGLLAVVSTLLMAAEAVSSVSLHSTPKLSGGFLLSLVVLLALYNTRKKLPFLPLGSSASWLQWHIYTGLLALVLFGLHVRWRVPNGILETMLSLLFLSVAGSGIAGLIVSRVFARRLTTRGEQVIFERIPVLQKRLQIEVEQLVLGGLSHSESAAISNFYTLRLMSFFERPRNIWPHLIQSHRARHRLLVEIASHERYLNDTERQVMREIADRVRTKDDLDYHYAHQASLKYWLFLHIPLSCALLVFAVFHVLLVYAFSGGIR